jgi:hypothetical protein
MHRIFQSVLLKICRKKIAIQTKREEPVLNIKRMCLDQGGKVLSICFKDNININFKI